MDTLALLSPEDQYLLPDMLSQSLVSGMSRIVKANHKNINSSPPNNTKVLNNSTSRITLGPKPNQTHSVNSLQLYSPIPTLSSSPCGLLQPLQPRHRLFPIHIQRVHLSGVHGRLEPVLGHQGAQEDPAHRVKPRGVRGQLTDEALLALARRQLWVIRVMCS